MLMAFISREGDMKNTTLAVMFFLQYGFDSNSDVSAFIAIERENQQSER